MGVVSGGSQGGTLMADLSEARLAAALDSACRGSRRGQLARTCLEFQPSDSVRWYLVSCRGPILIAGDPLPLLYQCGAGALGHAP